MSGLFGDKDAGVAEMREALALQKEAADEFRKIGIPDREAQELALQVPELVLASEEEKLKESAIEDIEVDPKLQQDALEALEELRTRGEEGFTVEDQARFEALRRRTAADEQARQASILQSMAERGALDSGAQLAAQLSSSQAAAQRQAVAAEQQAAEAARARREALSQAANLATGMQQQQFGRDLTQAQARDQIAQFNAAVAARDTGARRQQAQQQAEIQNFQEQYNKELVQREFENQMARARGVSGAVNQQAQGMMQFGGARAAADQQRAAGVRGMVKGILGSGSNVAAAAIKSDKNAKKDIKNVDVSKKLDKLDGYEYSYKDEDKDGEGKRTGVMAQDVEKIAPEAIMKDEDGNKVIDYSKLGPLMLASLSDLNKRLKKQEKKKYADGGLAALTQIDDKMMQKGLDQNFRERLRQSNPLELLGITGDLYSKNEPKEESMEDDKKEGNDKLAKAGLGALSDLLGGGSKEPDNANAFEREIKNIVSQRSNYGPEGYEEFMPKRSSIQQPRLSAKEGGYQKMGYEEGGMTEGRIVPGNNFEGDDLPDRINSGESVNNLEMQQNLIDMLREYQKLRTDEMAEIGLIKPNEEAQEELIDLARGDVNIDEAELDQNVLEPTEKGMNRLKELLKMDK